MSQVLLYRLRDVNCSLLVCHDDTAQAKRRLPNTALSVCEAVIHEPTVAQIHYAPFASASWAELAGVPPIDFNLQATPFEQELNDITIQVEPHRLDVKGMHDLAAGQGYDYPIEGTVYSVSSPVGLVAIGGAVAAGSFWIPCWKVTIRRNADKRDYDLHSMSDWTLTAAQIGQAWHPTIEVHLRTRMT